MCQARFSMSRRRACRLVGQHRSTERHGALAADPDRELRARLRSFAALQTPTPPWPPSTRWSAAGAAIPASTAAITTRSSSLTPSGTSTASAAPAPATSIPAHPGRTLGSSPTAPASRRVAGYRAVRHPARSAGARGRLGDRVQRRPTTLRPRDAHPGRVRSETADQPTQAPIAGKPINGVRSTSVHRVDRPDADTKTGEVVRDVGSRVCDGLHWRGLS